MLNLWQRFSANFIPSNLIQSKDSSTCWRSLQEVEGECTRKKRASSLDCKWCWESMLLEMSKVELTCRRNGAVQTLARRPSNGVTWFTNAVGQIYIKNNSPVVPGLSCIGHHWATTTITSAKTQAPSIGIRPKCAPRWKVARGSHDRKQERIVLCRWCLVANECSAKCWMSQFISLHSIMESPASWCTWIKEPRSDRKASLGSQCWFVKVTKQRCCAEMLWMWLAMLVHGW